MNLPNLLTLLRIFFVPLLVASLLSTSAGFYVGTWFIKTEFIALAIFLLAAATDLIDGYLARKWGQITTVGTLLDPIADKLLISAALIAMVQIHLLPAWVVILLIGREFAVTGFRSIAASTGYTIGASNWGKWKMVGQVLVVAMLIYSIHWKPLLPYAVNLTYVVACVSFYGAVDYFFTFWRGIDQTVKQRSRSELLMEEKDRLLEEQKRLRELRQLRREQRRAARRAALEQTKSTGTD